MDLLLTTKGTRLERDLLGERPVPIDAYWGIHTLRATENFLIPTETVGEFRELVRALGQVKKAAAQANGELGELPRETALAISHACDRVISGELDDQFPVHMLQGGAGTSTNMNANEVIANAALEYLGFEKGSYDVIHPNEHVNRGQSTNDVYPTSLKIASIKSISAMQQSLGILQDAFAAKAEEFSEVLKIGRTQLQDAVPMTLGQEFGSFEVMLDEDRLRIDEAAIHLHEINLGATAIGTGINSHPRFAEVAREKLEIETGLSLTTAPHLVEATQDCGAFVLLSGAVKRCAIKLSKVCNDLRLLSSGPRAGFAEISLPSRQAGSSIMPGKVNPVIPELVNQVAFEIVGMDATVTMAAEAGQLQLNAFEPVIAHSIFRGISHLDIAAKSLAEQCIEGISARSEELHNKTLNSLGIITLFNPHIGYVAATKVAQEAAETGESIPRILSRRGLVSDSEISDTLSKLGIALSQTDLNSLKE